MIVQTIIRKGFDHVVFCEDFLSTEDSGRYFIGAVFDGCSGGDDSHFASSLFGKMFRQILIVMPSLLKVKSAIFRTIKDIYVKTVP